MSIEIKQKIAAALSGFQTNNLFDNSINLFRALGYNTERQQKLDKPNYKSFKESFVEGNNKLFNEKKALTQSWKQVHLLFQLTKAELLNQGILFDTKKVDNKIIEAYLFFAIELDNNEYTRTHLSEITREINKLFPMPAMVLFKINNKLTLSVINRRLHKKDENKDVLEKITLIKDIDIANPHRGHIEILFDLSFQELYNNHQFDSFVSLHTAWQKTLDANELNKKFYQELANWYFWAIEKVEFPNDIKFHNEKDKDRQILNSTNVIRLITRLIFTWFLKEKNLVPDELFDEKKLKQIINSEDKTGSTYYKAILQNLFFATLNTPMNADQPGSRKFIKDQHLVHTLYRYERFFINKKRALELFENIPFLNGGLFECLDKKTDSDDIVRIDCFSDNPKNEKRLIVSDELFFSDYQQLDLNDTYQTKNRKYKVRGIIKILNSYKFTIHENTPIEEEVALDPELLGKVFENLLASYNPETETTARKQTGSFYTPREIVNYMVDESLLAYITNYLKERESSFNKDAIENKLKNLLNYSEAPTLFTSLQNKLIVEAISHIKILDPACGSGAFPMGVLHKLVYVLGKIDKNNIHWRELQKQKAIAETEEAFNIGNKQDREDKLKDISDTFENNNGDYGRKLYLIENSIYGVDIQPIAVQIAKLRFFISLIVDQRIDTNAENIGVRPLPNLETKFVAANTLIGIERPMQQTLRNPLIDVKEKELKQIREKHFTARTPKTKEKYRLADAVLRNQIAALLNQDGFGSKTTQMLANWNPYNQNTSAAFFDTEWMFNFVEGFDLVIGNPPYISYYSKQSKQLDKQEEIHLRNNYLFLKKESSKLRINSAMFFFEKGLKVLTKNGILCFIVDLNVLENPFLPIRKFITNRNSINEIITDLVAFENVASGQIIVRISAKHDNENNVKIKKGLLIDTHLQEEVFVNQLEINEVNSFSWTTPKNGLIKIIETDKKLLDSFLEVHTGVAVNASEDGKAYFIRDSFIKNSYPFLTGSDSIVGQFCKPIWSKYLLYDKKAERELNDEFDSWYFNQKGSHQRPFNLRRMEEYDRPKILLRQADIRFTATYSEELLFGNYSIFNLYSPTDDKEVLKFILALLNSKILSYYAVQKEIILVKPGKTPQIRSGQRGPIGIRQLPIVETESSNLLSSIVDYLLFLNEAKEKNTLIISFYQNLINSIVYELYLPELVKNAKCEILKYLNDFVSIEIDLHPDKKNKIIQSEYQRLSAETHPVRKSMHFMDTIEEIAIIEGKQQ